MKSDNQRYIKMLIIFCGMAAASIGICQNTPGVFYTAVSEDLNVYRGTFAFHATLSLIGTAMMALLAPRIMARIPMRLLTIFGASAMILTTLGMSVASNVGTFYFLGICRGIGSGLCANVPVTILLNHWFRKRNGTATSIALSFAGFASASCSPILSRCIVLFGWRAGYLCQAAILLLFMLPGIIIPFHSYPDEDGYLAYGEDESGREKSAPRKTVNLQAGRPAQNADDDSSSPKSMPETGEASKKVAGEEVMSKVALPKEALSAEASPTEALSKEASPTEALSKEASPTEALSNEASLKEALSNEASPKEVPGFRFLSLPFLCIAIFAFFHASVTAVSQHISGYAVSLGFSTEFGAMLLSLIMIGNISTKLVLGIISDRAGAFPACILMILTNILSLYLFFWGAIAHSHFMLIIGAFLFGSIYAVSAVGVAILARETFGLDRYQTVYPKISFLVSSGSAMSLPLIGYIYDFTGSYTPVLFIAAGIHLMNLCLLSILRKNRVSTQSM